MHNALYLYTIEFIAKKCEHIMNKIIVSAFFTVGIIFTTANAAPIYNLSVSAEYSRYDAEIDGGESVDLSGFALSISPNSTSNGLFGKFDVLSADDLDADYLEISGGYQHNLINQNNFYALASIGLGYAQIKSSYIDEDINYLSIPIGLEAGYTFIPQASVFAGFGYKWSIDTASEEGSGARCRDGYRSKSIGKQGACSSHGGVVYTQSGSDNSYSANGLTTRIGLRYNF